MKDDDKIVNTNNKVKRSETVQTDSYGFAPDVNKANIQINDEFYRDSNNPGGISPALLVVNAPLVDTDDQFINQKKER